MSELIDDSQPPRAYPKWLWLVGALVLVMGGVALYSFFLGRKVQTRLEAIKAAGYPVTGYDLNVWHEQVAADENAAPKILEAARFLATKGKQVGDVRFPNRSQPISIEMRTNLQQLLRVNDPAFASVREAAHRTKSRYPVQWQAGPGTLLPHLAEIKGVAQLLRAQALLAAEDGDVTLAIQDIEETVKVGESLRTEPATISQLVRISCLKMAITELERLMNRQALTPQQCANLQKLFLETEAEVQKGATRGLVGERCLGSFVFRMTPGQMRSLGEDLPVLYAITEFTGLRKADFLFYLDMMDRSIKASELPFPESLEKTRALGETLNQEIAHHPFFMMSKLMLPALQKSSEKMARIVADLRCAQAALAVEQSRAQHEGKAPESLQQLIPALLPTLSIDPFDGKPLRFEWVKAGFQVYSVGEDGKDDGGAEPAKPNSAADQAYDRVATGPRDAVFKVERSADGLSPAK